MEFEYKYSILTIFFTFSAIIVFKKIFDNYQKLKNKKKVYKQEKEQISNVETKKDPFVICFRKTRTEAMIISRVEEIQKQRDIQFIVSFYNYRDDKSINGSFYIITSKMIYKLVFMKYKIITTDFHELKTFVVKNNPMYKYILNYLNTNKNCQKEKHHNEFYTWPYYFFTNNYDEEQSIWEKFIKKC